MSTSQNVIARMGNDAPKIIVCAHYDCVYDSPGAVDNASGVQALMNVADRLLAEAKQGKNIPSLTFICFGCEELKFNGSHHYVKYLQEHNELDSIRYVVNLDMIGHGTDITVSRGCGMEAFTDPLAEEYAPRFKSKFVTGEAKPTSDHWAFHESKIATVQFTSLPYPHYHQKVDTMEQFDPLIMGETEEFAMALLRKLFEALKN
jgi:Zn-dependent M28 family amino/carboxypeptidase